MYLVRGKLRPPSPHPLFTRNITLGHLLSFCHIVIKKMRSPQVAVENVRFSEFSDSPLKHYLVSLRLFKKSSSKTYSTNKGKKASEGA